MTFAPGDPIRVEVTKWGDRPHWEFDGVWLGSDAYGEWLGFPTGTHNARPGFAFDSEVDAVTLVPRDAFWLATFHAPGIWCDTYVDISTPSAWDGTVLRTVDLDLDVIRRDTGEVYLDDEDEFLEHQVAFGYPADVIAAARASADEVFAAVEQRRAPYDGSHRRWLEQLS